jgi:RNA polymerase sigma-70 factor (ECF subfamily)
MLVRLVERARAGDNAAFRELVDLEADRCFAVAYRIVRDRDRAHDAVQRSLLQAWRDLPQLRDPNRFEPWLYRLLVRACWEERRRLRSWVERVAPIEADRDADRAAAGDFTLSVSHRDALERAFARLSLEHRTVVVLHHYAGMPLSAVADVVGAPIGTVKSRLHHALNALRAALDADDRLELPEGRTA